MKFYLFCLYFCFLFRTSKGFGSAESIGILMSEPFYLCKSLKQTREEVIPGAAGDRKSFGEFFKPVEGIGV